jgi:hypothetical protein
VGGFFLVSQQRLRFPSEYIIVPTRKFEEFRATALVQLQGAATQLFDSTPEFRLHVDSPRSAPAGAKPFTSLSTAPHGLGPKFFRALATVNLETVALKCTLAIMPVVSGIRATYCGLENFIRRAGISV